MASVPLRIAALIASSDSSSPPEVRVHQRLVLRGDGLEHLLAVAGSLVDHVGGDVDGLVLRAEVLLVDVAPDEGLHLDQVDETFEGLDGLGAAGADRQLDDEGVRLEAVLHHVDGAVEVGTDAVHLVDEAHARHVVLVGLAPDGLGLRLDAGDGVEHGDGTVEHAERALDFDGEVDVTRGVDDVDAVVVPDAGGGGGGDRDATLLLLGHVVHGGGAVVDLADLVALPGVVEDALGRGGLAGIDVRHDPDVPGALQGKLSLGHTSHYFRYVWDSQGATDSGNPSQVVPVRLRTSTAFECTGGISPATWSDSCFATPSNMTSIRDRYHVGQGIHSAQRAWSASSSTTWIAASTPDAVTTRPASSDAVLDEVTVAPSAASSPSASQCPVASRPSNRPTDASRANRSTSRGSRGRRPQRAGATR